MFRFLSFPSLTRRFRDLSAGELGKPFEVVNEKAVRASTGPASLKIGGARFGATVTTSPAKKDTIENSPTILRLDEIS